MRVEQLGDGEPELAIVGGVHGDEPCGVRAIERLLGDDSTVERPVRLVVANERALERDERYVDADLNRAFDDSAPATAHERDLADKLAAAVRGCTVLSLHSTHSSRSPFAISSGVDELTRSVVPGLSVEALVETKIDDGGRLFATDADIIEVEAGYQGSAEAAENAYRIAREFLTVTGALAGQTVERDLPVYELEDPIRKPPADEYEVFAQNFEHVDPGETYAAADGDPLTDEEGFNPILFSAFGYEHIFGYRGGSVGTLQCEGTDTPTLCRE